MQTNRQEARTFVLAVEPDALDHVNLEALSRRARLAAGELRREGTRVHLLRSVYVPEDESFFLLFSAVDAEAAHEAARRADIRVVAEAVVTANGKGEDHG